MSHVSPSGPGLDTRAVHAGQVPDPATNARAVPIYQTTSYVFNDTQHAADLFALRAFGNIYSRIMNPTNDVLEQRLAALAGGSAGLVTASGMSAIFYTVATLASAGQNIVSTTALYGGTVTLFTHTLKRFGIDVRLVDTTDPANVERAIDANTRLVFTESIGNPKGNVDDFPAIAEIAHRHGIPFVIDATVSPPPLLDAFAFGADIVNYSLTKMIGGHGNSIGGAIVESGRFDWAAAGKFPELTEPDPSYHGIKFFEAFGPLAFCLKARCGLLRDTGACLSPMNAFLILQGVETLPLRAHQHVRNAMKVAQFLSTHPNVAWVNYPGLSTHPDYARAQRFFPHGPGAILGFGIKSSAKDGLEAGRKLIESVKLASHLANILDAKTLVIHPASTTHQQLTETQQRRAGVTPDFIRVSVGIEDVDDIIADLDQALRAAG